MSIHFIFLYIVTVFVASIIPGPSMLLALTHGMQHGTRKTICSALGNMSVTLLQAAVSIAGLGTILIASETVFGVIKWAGAVYLVYLGIIMLRSSGASLGMRTTGRSAQTTSHSRLFMQGALVTAGNPKAIIFFTAIFPQFIDPGSHYLTQSAILLCLLAAIAFSCYMLYALCGQKIVSLFVKEKVRKRISRVIGGTFIGAGAGLALSNR